MASGKHAFGFCDRSGFRYPLKDLVPQWENGVPNGLLVGKDMVDIDHEQLKIGDVDASDNEALRNPRPDQSLSESRALSSWKPVGANMFSLEGRVGKVTVTTG